MIVAVVGQPLLAALGFAAAGLGTLGGLGGAVLLVPALVLAGVEPVSAAPLGLAAVAAGSVAAAASQIEAGLVNHRIGVLTETAASVGAVGGALVAASVSAGALRWLLAGAAVLASLAGLLRPGARRPDAPAFVAETPGEWPGTLSGAEPSGAGVVPYAAHRPLAGSAAMAAAGFVAGVSGTSGGYLKTPVASQVMAVPLRVAAATTTFTVGVTAAAALLVFAGQGHLDLRAAAAVVAGALAGGRAGARIQEAVPARLVQLVLSVVLLGVAPALVLTG